LTLFDPHSVSGWVKKLSDCLVAWMALAVSDSLSLVCGICREDFDDLTNIPQITSCGHTYW
jgi:hypothetical protein